MFAQLLYLQFYLVEYGGFQRLDDATLDGKSSTSYLGLGHPVYFSKELLVTLTHPTIVLIVTACVFTATSKSVWAIRMHTASREANVRGRGISQGDIKVSRDANDDNLDVEKKIQKNAGIVSVKSGAGEASASCEGTLEIADFASGTVQGTNRFGGMNILPDDVAVEMYDRWSVDFEADAGEHITFQFQFPAANYPAPALQLLLQQPVGIDTFDIIQQQSISPSDGLQIAILTVPAAGNYRFSTEWTLPETILPAGDSDFQLTYAYQWTSVPEPCGSLLAFIAAIGGLAWRRTH